MTGPLHVPKGPITLVVLCILGSALIACASSVKHTPTPSENWVGIASDVSGATNSESHNALFSVSSEGISEEQLLPPVYFPAFQRYEGGYVTPSREGILFVDSKLNEVGHEPIPQLGLPTQSSETSSASNEHILWSFNTGTEESPYQRLVVALSDGAVRTIERDQRLIGSRICDDGSSQWLEENPHGSAPYKLVTFSSHGDIFEKELQVPHHHKLMSSLSYLGCDQEDSFLVLQDSSGDAAVVSLDRTNAELSKESSGLDSIPRVNLPRASLVRDEKLYQFTDEARLSTIDFRSSSVTYSEPLLPPTQKAISLTFDRDEFYVVSQPHDGGDELEIRAYALSSPAFKEKGETIGSLNSLLKASEDSIPKYVIPLAIYPREPH